MDNSLILSVLTWLLLVPFFLSLLKHQYVDLFLPPVLFSICVFAGYVLPVSSFIEGTDVYTLSWGLPSAAFEQSLTMALAITILGVMGFYIGYICFAECVPNGRSLPYVAHSGCVELNQTRLLLVGIIYSVVGLGLFAVGVVVIGGPAVLFEGLGDRLRLFAGLNYFFSAINLLLVTSLVWWAHLLSVRRTKDKLFWTYTILAVASSSLQGAKSVLVVHILCMVVIYHLLYRKVSLFISLCGGISLLIGMSAYGLLAREYMFVGDFVTIDVTDLSFDSLLEVIRKEVEGNFLQLQVLTTIVENVPVNIPYQHGTTYLSLLTSIIPATIYPDKYLTAPGIFTLALWPDRWLSQGTTLPPGLMGEMYMNFGTIGVFLGMSLFGCIFGYGYARVRSRASGLKPTDVALYALLVAMIPHYIRGEAVAPTILLAILGLPLFLAGQFVYQRRTRATYMASFATLHRP